MSLIVAAHPNHAAQSKPDSTVIPVCSKQERFLFYEECRADLAPSGTVFNVPIVLDCVGHLEIEALQLALQTLAYRHCALRSAFRPARTGTTSRAASLECYRLTGVTTSGAFNQSISSSTSFPLRQIELKAMSLDDIIAAELSTTIDHGAAPLARALLVRLGHERHVLIVVLHHLIADYWSARVVRRELECIYRAQVLGHSAVLPDVTGRYESFIQSEFHRPSDDTSKLFWANHWRYWRRWQISHDEFCISRPGQAGVGRVISQLDAELSTDIKRSTRRHQVTVYTLFYGALCVVLRERVCRNRFTVWTNFSNRTTRASADIVAWVVNSHMLGVDLPGQLSGLQALTRIRRQIETATVHQEVALPCLWRALGHSLETTHLRVVLDYFVRPRDREFTPGLRMTPLRVAGLHPEAQLTFEVVDTQAGFEIRLFYANDRFDVDAAREILERFTGVALAMVDAAAAPISSY